MTPNRLQAQLELTQSLMANCTLAVAHGRIYIREIVRVLATVGRVVMQADHGRVVLVVNGYKVFAAFSPESEIMLLDSRIIDPRDPIFSLTPDTEMAHDCRYFRSTTLFHQNKTAQKQGISGIINLLQIPDDGGEGFLPVDRDLLEYLSQTINLFFIQDCSCRDNQALVTVAATPTTPPFDHGLCPATIGDGASA